MRTSLFRRGLMVVAALGLVLFTAAAGVPSAAAEPTVTRVMSALDNPRGLAFGPQGALYVAEAGRGGFGSSDPPASLTRRCSFGYPSHNRPATLSGRRSAPTCPAMRAAARRGPR